MADSSKYIIEALENIRKDRLTAHDLLDEAQMEISKPGGSHAHGGLAVAKYLEAAQRSNEQLVKLVTLIMKNSEETEDMSKDDIYAMIGVVEKTATETEDDEAN